MPYYILREYFPRNPEKAYSCNAHEDEGISVFSRMGYDNDDNTFTRVERDRDDYPMAFEAEEDAFDYMQGMKHGNLIPCKYDELELRRVWVEDIEEGT